VLHKKYHYSAAQNPRHPLFDRGEAKNNPSPGTGTSLKICNKALDNEFQSPVTHCGMSIVSIELQFDADVNF
jgi:hypothetical protein